MTTDISGQAVTFVCRPTGRGRRHPGDKPPTIGKAPVTPVAAGSKARTFKCAHEGCEAKCALTEEMPLPEGWVTFVRARTAGAGVVIGYHCPDHAPKTKEKKSR